ncbi:MAG: hypothetical protein JRH20_25245 [Deltaproteobacteria bacterium]|nr:hypothetical protein [Deltaproteobacteria bacterium]
MRIFLLGFLVASIFSSACSEHASQDDAGGDQAVDAMRGDTMRGDTMRGDTMRGDALPVELEVGPDRDGSADGSVGCPQYGVAEVMGTLDNVAINEASGLVHSRKNAEVLWVHNDSGDTPRLFAISTEGRHLGTYTLEGATAIDWEDMAIGPGPSTGEDYLYIGDIGDYMGRRSSVQVYRVIEPTLRADQSPVNETLQGVDTIELRYSEGVHNAETLLVDPLSGELTIITEGELLEPSRSTGVLVEPSMIFSAPSPLRVGEEMVMSKVGEVRFGEDSLKEVVWGLASGGDISADGSEIVLLSHEYAIWWPRVAGETVAQALVQEPCLFPLSVNKRGGAVALSPGKKDYFTLSEGELVPLHRSSRK